MVISMKRIIFILVVLLVISITLVFIYGPSIVERQLNRVEPHQSYTITTTVQQLHDRLIIGDWHADSLLWNRNLAERNAQGHVDIPRLQAGNVALQMFTTVTKSPNDLNYGSNDSEAQDNISRLVFFQRWPVNTLQSLTARAIYQADKLHRLVEENPDNLRLITSQQTLQNFLDARRTNAKLVGALLGTEGSHALEGKLNNIDVLYKKGFRMMSLQHFFDNQLGGSLHGLKKSGLSELGEQMVNRMQALDIIVDVSHSSEKTVEDVLAISSKPLVVSHTGFRGHCKSQRNISDELMTKIAQADGLIAVGFWDGAVCSLHPQHIVDAVIYGIKLVGENHVALGSDFDGSVTTALDASELAILTQLMLESGMNERQVGLVMGGNMLRFLQANLPAT